jgi:hypothetical protein
VLDLPIEPGNDADASTVREYLLELIATLWRQGDGFSSKRPFGESTWQYSIYTALLRAGLVTGQFDEDGYVRDVDYAAADDLICRAIRDVLGHRPLPPAGQVAYEATEWCAWYGGEDPNEAAGVHVVDDEEEAREVLRWYRDDLGAGVARRRTYTTAWEPR